MIKLVFYGDSLTSGENNNFVSFVDKLDAKNIQCVLNAVSGTTFGEYSIYPVDHLSFSELLHQSTDDIRGSDVIFIEYGVNDTTSICLDYVSLKKVLLDFRKCVDLIRQNSEARLIFLALGDDTIVSKMGELQSNYITSDYLNESFHVNPIQWAETYEKIVNFAYEFCDDVWYMFNTYSDFIDNLDDDNLHPNDIGHGKISQAISDKIESL